MGSLEICNLVSFYMKHDTLHGLKEKKKHMFWNLDCTNSVIYMYNAILMKFPYL